MRKLVRIGVILIGAGASALARQPPDTGWIPVLQLRAVAAMPTGETTNVSREWKLRQGGDPLGVTFSTGSTLCAVGTAAADTDAEAAAQPTIWTVSGDYLGMQNGRQQVRVTSRFVRLAGRTAPPPTTQTLSLQDGDAVTLDAISDAIDPSCKVHTLTFEARLTLQPTDPALARAQYSADLWLVHNGPLSAQLRDHLIINVDGNSTVPFLFKQLSFTLPQVDARQGSLAGAITLAGSLRARPRLDGLVDLDLDTNRVLYGLNTPGPAIPSMVRKTLTLKPDETTAVDFPPPASGFISTALGSGGGDRTAVGAGQAAPGRARSTTPSVRVEHERLVLDTAAFFRGHKTQLLITLHKLR